MTQAARELLHDLERELAPSADDNQLVPLIARGEAARPVLGALAAEQRLIIASDWRSFLSLAARSGPAGREFFTSLAQGEGLAAPTLPPLAAAAGLDSAGLDAYEPTAGCQAYPAYLAWLALNGDPTDVILAVTANFAAWGGYCATISAALREHYGFDDEACGFFDFFATPAPELAEQAVAAVDAGDPTPLARRYGRLLQSYELMFWRTLAARA